MAINKSMNTQPHLDNKFYTVMKHMRTLFFLIKAA